MNVRGHIEHHLGEPQQVYRVGAPDRRFNILRFDGLPHQDAVTYVTEGTSSVALRQPNKPPVRQELVFAVRSAYASEEARRPIGAVADQVLSSKMALIRGEVIDSPDMIIKGTGLSGVCCLAPAILTKDLWFYGETDPPTMFVWLIPLTTAEVAFARRVGPDDFEEALVDAQAAVDLLDLHRAGFVP